MNHQLTNQMQKVQVVAIVFGLLLASSLIGFTTVHGYGGQSASHGQGLIHGNGQGHGNGNGLGEQGNNGNAQTNATGNGAAVVTPHAPSLFSSFVSSILSFFRRG